MAVSTQVEMKKKIISEVVSLIRSNFGPVLIVAHRYTPHYGPDQLNYQPSNLGNVQIHSLNQLK